MKSLLLIYLIFMLLPRQRPYHVEYTSSRLITEVKQHWARIVLGWETAWELLVLLAFFYLGLQGLGPFLALFTSSKLHPDPT